MVVALALVGAGFDSQIEAQRPPHFGPLLARNCQQFGRVIVSKDARETDIARLVPVPAITFRQRSSAQFKGRTGQPLRQIPCRIDQRRDRARIGRQHTAPDRKTARYQRAAEQRRMHLGQRQHAGQIAVTALGDQGMRHLSAAARHRQPPFGQVKRRRGVMRLDERGNARAFARVAQIGGADRDGRHGKGRVHGVRAASIAATRSVRPHAWSRINASSLPSIAASRL